VNTNDLITRQTAAIRRASRRSNPQPYPGGTRTRSEAELALAEVLRNRHDADLYADQIIGAEMAGRALAVVADLEDRDKSNGVTE
jgi:hypothetical protein